MCIRDRKADKVIFPGVGEAGSAMRYLSDKGLDRLIRSLNQPVLGICLGLQLMCSHSEESDAKCLGIFDSQVRMFPLTDKVPHMGWNNLSSVKGELFKGFPLTGNVYFVHSYYAEVSIDTSAVCEYILPFSAAMEPGVFSVVLFFFGLYG